MDVFNKLYRFNDNTDRFYKKYMIDRDYIAKKYGYI